MKRKYVFSNHVFRLFLLGAVLCLFANTMMAQEEATENKKDTRPVREMFKSNWLLNNETAIVPIKGTFEFDIQHRFGTMNNGYDDFYGLYAPSNIRLGFSYVPMDNLQIGFGFTKLNLLWDANVKYNILHQGRRGGAPVNLTYFGNIAIETRDKAFFHNSTDRISYFHQLMVARKVTDNFSMQVGGSVSHFNKVDAFINTTPEIVGKMKNDHVAVNVMGRYKVNEVLAIMANYDQPITEHKTNNPHPNISFGLEMSTSAHSFQIFAGNYNSIVPQYNNVFNQNDYTEGDFLIGFNITRLWNL